MALRPLLLFCLLAAAAVTLCILPAQATRNNVQDCCQATRDNPLHIRHANKFKTYRVQEPRMGCSVPAIVLITKKKGRGLCFPPDSQWALPIVKVLDARAARKQRRS